MSIPSTPQDGQAKKRPASQYYWGDWWKDKGLHSCSLTARGLWHEMNCLMHEGEPYGHLTLNGKPMTVAQLANQCRITVGQCAKLLKELEEAGVPSRTAEGVLFSRRMVRDEAVRNARAEGGKAGAEHGIKGAEHGAKGGRPKEERGVSEGPLQTPLKPPPSSSSSSSPSGDEESFGLVGEDADPPPAGSKPDPVPRCQAEAIVGLFHEVLPELPKAKLMTDKRRRAIATFWRWVLTSKKSDGTPRASTADQALTWIRQYFERARANDFLMGRTQRHGEHANWRCDIDFLLTERGMKHVIEKTVEATT